MFKPILLWFACAGDVPPAGDASGSPARADLPAELVEKGSIGGDAQLVQLGIVWDVAEVTGDAEPDLLVVAGDGTGWAWGGAIWVLPGPILREASREDVHVIFPPWGVPIRYSGAGDLDGDGLAEVWAGDRLLTGPISGDIDLAAVLPIDEGCWLGAALGDLDGDGAVEATLHCEAGSHVLSRPEPDGPLADAATTALSVPARSVGDLDGDGLGDLSWLATDGFRVAYAPFGAALDDAMADVTVPGAGLESLHPAGDPDGDGAPDLFVSVAEAGASYLLAGPFEGEVSVADPACTILPAAGGEEMHALHGRGLGDVDGDGFLDAGGGDPEWPHPDTELYPDEVHAGAVWLAAGPLEGSIEAAPWQLGQGYGARISEVRPVGDLDGDGLPEIAYADPEWSDPYGLGGMLRFFGVGP